MALISLRPVRMCAISLIIWDDRMLGIHFAQHAPVVRGVAEQLRIERNAPPSGWIPSGSAKSAAVISGRFGTPAWLMISFGGSVVRPQLLQHVDEVLRVAQIGKLGRGRDDDLVRLHQRVLRPAVPGMRNVEHQQRRAALRRVDQMRERIGIEIVDAVERRRRRKQRQDARRIVASRRSR